MSCKCETVYGPGPACSGCGLGYGQHTEDCLVENPGVFEAKIKKALDPCRCAQLRATIETLRRQRGELVAALQACKRELGRYLESAVHLRENIPGTFAKNAPYQQACKLLATINVKSGGE